MTVATDTNVVSAFVTESDEDNNSRTVATAVVDEPANLVVTAVRAPAQNFSGEKTTVTWTVRNDGGDVWSGTRLWVDTHLDLARPGLRRARAAARLARASARSRPRPRRELHREHRRRRSRPGSTGRTSCTSSPTPSRTPARPTPFAGATEVHNGGNAQTITYYSTHVYEDLADTDNVRRATIDVTYREPDLKITRSRCRRAAALGPGRHGHVHGLEHRHA